MKPNSAAAPPAFISREVAPQRVPADVPTRTGREFRKKPVVIQAEEFQPDYLPLPFREQGVCCLAGKQWFIQTLEGPLNLSPGDIVIRGVKGEFYPCKPDIFAATYEPVEQAASPSSVEGQQETRMFPVMSDILPLSCAERERLQQLAEKATEGPWTNGMHGNNDAHMCLIVTRAKLSDATVDCGYGIGRTWHPEKLMAYVGISRQQCIDNAEFIAAAREALPRYEQTVRALEVIAKNVLHCDNCGGSYWSGGTGTVTCPLCKLTEQAATLQGLREQQHKLYEHVCAEMNSLADDVQPTEASALASIGRMAQLLRDIRSRLESLHG